MWSRRQFFGLVSAPMVLRPFSQPRSGHPILDSVIPVVREAGHVTIHQDRIEDVAGWMAYEALGWPDFRSPLVPEGDDEVTMDFLFLTSTINFAFTDFNEHVVFQTSYRGTTYSDSDAMMASLKRAHDEGVPILDGAFLASVDRTELSRIFAGNIEIPMLEERLRIFHEVGRVLADDIQGPFHRFALSGGRRVYADGGGLLERLIAAFPSFRDETRYQARPVVFHKRAQLLLWQLHARFRNRGFFELEDAGRLTIFADYIVPVALRLFGITTYSAELEQAIHDRRLLPPGSPEEVEIRAASIWACHLLTEAINRRRPPDRQVIEPVVDARLWTHYHETHWPHHLTRTTAY